MLNKVTPNMIPLLINTLNVELSQTQILKELEIITGENHNDLLLGKSLDYVYRIIQKSPLLEIPDEFLICIEDHQYSNFYKIYNKIQDKFHTIAIKEESLGVTIRDFLADNDELFDIKNRLDILKPKNNSMFDIAERFFDITPESTIMDIQRIVEQPDILLTLYYLFDFKLIEYLEPDGD